MRLVLPLLGVSLAALAVAGQTPPAQTPFRTEANYILVDMYPTVDGRPVLDLRAEEVEVLDQGTPQRIDQFEHVLLRGPRPQSPAAEPTTVAEARAPAPGPRARLFVLFLDRNHVDVNFSVRMNRHLTTALNTMIGGDDLIAVMMPGMPVRDVTFTTRTSSIDEVLRMAWGTRDRWVMLNPEEAEYVNCYTRGPQISPIAQEMILRRREKQSLDAVDELVEHLGTLRPERKTILTISYGWRLFGEGLQQTTEPQPVTPPTVDPLSGRITTRDTSSPRVTAKCEADRKALGKLRHEERFREILNRANRANITFYPIDPRGVAVFDDDILPVASVGTPGPPDLTEDRRRVGERLESLQTMAEETGGLAIANTRDLDAGLRRIEEDSSSYYLLGFYSTVKQDGRFHGLTVRVKRPGVQVRARRGYLAARADERTTSAAPGGSAATPVPASAVAAPLAALSALARERPLRSQAAAGWTPSGAARVWVVIEPERQSGRAAWAEGSRATVTLVDAAGATIVTQDATPTGTTPGLMVELRPERPLAPGDYQIQVRVGGAGSLPVTDTAYVSIAAAPVGTGALFTRRGNTTGNRDLPTADLRFARTERITIETPARSNDAGAAQLLDRAGRPMFVPVVTALKQDADGITWRTAALTLAPLAPGDYVIKISSGGEDTLVAFRVRP